MDRSQTEKILKNTVYGIVVRNELSLQRSSYPTPAQARQHGNGSSSARKAIADPRTQKAFA
jgi:hypothetical protein